MRYSKEDVHTGCSAHDQPLNLVAPTEADSDWACLSVNALQACSNWTRVSVVEGVDMKRGNELYSSKPPSYMANQQQTVGSLLGYLPKQRPTRSLHPLLS